MSNYTYTGTQITSIFEGEPPKQGLFQSKQGSLGFQVYIYIYTYNMNIRRSSSGFHGGLELNFMPFNPPKLLRCEDFGLFPLTHRIVFLLLMVTPPKTNMTGWKFHHLKMYFLLNMRIFHDIPMSCSFSGRVFLFGLRMVRPWCMGSWS